MNFAKDFNITGDNSRISVNRGAYAFELKSKNYIKRNHLLVFTKITQC
jgi:hypothetical protein